MKKISTILLLSIHLLNLTGYSLFFEYFIDQSDQQMVEELDNGHYDDSELIQIKVPLYLPYTTNWHEYERCDGAIELNGIHYNYVKRKIYNDTLYLLCIPNKTKTQLYKVKNEYARNVSDINSSTDKKQNDSHAKKNVFESEYDYQTVVNVSLFACASSLQSDFLTSCILTSFITSPDKPPEIISGFSPSLRLL